MTTNFEQKIELMANGLKAQSQNKKVKVFLSYLYTQDITDKYLNIFLTYKNVTRAGFAILHSLILNGGSLTPTVLSKEVNRSKFSITRVLDTLENLGLVKRTPASEDRRSLNIVITEKGLETVQKSTLASREILCENIFKNFNEMRLNELDSLLRELRNNVRNLIEPDEK